jgi:hypothetical protein
MIATGSILAVCSQWQHRKRGKFAGEPRVIRVLLNEPTGTLTMYRISKEVKKGVELIF